MAGLGPLSSCSLQVPGRLAKIPRIGWANIVTADNQTFLANLAGLRDGLGALGYREGESVVLELRFAGGRIERLDELTAERLGLPVDLLLVGNQQSLDAARRATTFLPIVFAGPLDPLSTGLIAKAL